MQSAAVKVEAQYRIPIEHHNPMEPHAAITFWEADKLTIFDETQDVYGVRAHLASSFGVAEENVTVVSPFVGGGGVVWGIGMALQEATEIDHRYGRIMNPNLQHYHVPVNADVHQIETMFVEEDDRIVNPLGVKGMGELGMVGIPAAIANAVFHATGRRVRDLPITPDKLL
jgi:CO/xanthine dehydrogenase Mo-binding subunit